MLVKQGHHDVTIHCGQLYKNEIVGSEYKRGTICRIPSSDGGEYIDTTAARVIPKDDVIETRQAVAVQPRVEPAKRAVAPQDPIIIQQRDHPGHGGRRAARTGAQKVRVSPCMKSSAYVAMSACRGSTCCRDHDIGFRRPGEKQAQRCPGSRRSK